MLLSMYLLNAGIVATILIWSFLVDQSTPKRHRLSWLVILVASAFWFIVVPLSCVEIVRRSLHQRKVLQDQSNPTHHIS